MVGVENFFGFDDADGKISAEAVEAFREQMSRNAAQMASLKRGEQKQKKKEDELIAILVKFLKSGQKSAMLTLIAKLLAENIPAAIILSIISLGSRQIQKEIKINLALPSGKSTEENVYDEKHLEKIHHADFSEGKGLPEHLKLEVNLWFEAIFEAMDGYAQRTLKTVVNPLNSKEITPKLIVTQLAGMVLRDFLHEKGLKKMEMESLRVFTGLSLAKILKTVKIRVEERKQLD